MVNVQELQRKSIPEIIKILRIFENEDIATVDLVKLGYTLNVSILSRNSEEIRIMGEQIMGAFATNNSNGNSGIFYSDDLQYNTARIIIVQAFAKYIITGENNFFIIQSTNFSKREKILANEMLMPKSQVEDVIRKLIIPSTTTLADIFQVSPKFVCKRLAELGILTRILGYNC